MLDVLDKLNYMKNILFSSIILLSLKAAVYGQNISSIYDFTMISNQSINFYFFEDACKYCDSLTENGYSDWILPSSEEWLFITNKGSILPFSRTATWLILRGSYLDQGSNFRRIWGNTFGDVFWSGTTSACSSPGPHNNCPQYVRCIR